MFDPSAEESLFSVEQMYRADQLAIESGMSGFELMSTAGLAVADALRGRWNPRPLLVLCGPGNNGGDGFIAAETLRQAGWPVRLFFFGDRQSLKGDAELAADDWCGEIEAPDLSALEGSPLLVDALFGAGLTRPLDGLAATFANEAASRGLPVVSIDVPSGLPGDGGSPQGPCFKAELTVTFQRAKSGHLLDPGRSLCGEVVVCDIAIPDAALEQAGLNCWRNDPSLWRGQMPGLLPSAHKYQRGHCLVVGGREMTGAARLAAGSALRSGVGLVTIACSPETLQTYQLSSPSFLVHPSDSAQALAGLVAERRISSIVVGPGLGRDERAREQVLALLSSRCPIVLDADALSVFENEPEVLFSALHASAVLTPHEGEFGRLFGALPQHKLHRARKAAEMTGAVVLIKGRDSVLAAPNGCAVINDHAPPWLATAGSGDVLAGLIGGLLGQGLLGFVGGAAAIWCHGEAAYRLGRGMISEDLEKELSNIFQYI